MGRGTRRAAGDLIGDADCARLHTSASSRVHTVASGVSVTAFPAGCANCLLIEWDGASGHHRLLIDGGMASALDEGLGRYATSRPEGHLLVDVAVVTQHRTSTTSVA